MEMPPSKIAEHPALTSSDAIEQPIIVSNDAEEKHTISNEAEEQPTISNEAEEPPTISNDAIEHPTIISSDAVEHPTRISDDADYHHEDIAPNVLNDGNVEPNHDIAEEVKKTLEAIASTGKFWHDWQKLRNMLSFQLNQVLSLYPEAKTTPEQQSASLGETLEELEKRLNEALFNFVGGPPFTLQRVCEILLEARSIYPNLSKLALALEKNLLVTSTLAISATTQKADEANKSVQNGIVGERDEIMAEVEEVADIDMDALEGIVGPSETNSTNS